MLARKPLTSVLLGIAKAGKSAVEEKPLKAPSIGHHLRVALLVVGDRL
jgi:hypothetical protein